VKFPGSLESHHCRGLPSNPAPSAILLVSPLLEHSMRAIWSSFPPIPLEFSRSISALLQPIPLTAPCMVIPSEHPEAGAEALVALGYR
jgi:hypothetical protein